MKYTPRLTAPSKDNKYYYQNNIFYKCGYGMPNCTCYAWGRFYELTNIYPKLSTSNAENWYGKADGYSRGNTPKLGAIACWSKGKVGIGSDGAGHVAVVEEIKNDGTIVTSNSGYKSTNFYLKTIKPPYALNGYNFQGFIYLPIEFIKEEEKSQEQPKTPSNNDLLLMVKKTIRGDYGNGEARKKALGSNYNEVQRQVNLNYKNGTTRWDNIKLY